MGVRTRLTDATTQAYFLFDALSVFDDSSLAAAMDDLCDLLRAGWPAVGLATTVVS